MSTDTQQRAPVAGHCDPRFSRVGEVFAASFVAGEEVGAAVSVSIGDQTVVDLYGGWADADRTSPWRPDTLVNVYSAGKGVIAMLALILIERGLLDLDRPVAAWWPEFAANDKGSLSLRGLMSHRAGLPALRQRLPATALDDWDVICGALAAQAPFWQPGEKHGYHVNTYGFLVGELIRRSTGMSVSRALHEYLCGPVDADFFFGLPVSEHGRAAWVHQVAPPDLGPEHWPLMFPPSGDPERDLMVWHSYFNPDGISGVGIINSARWRSAVIPSANGHGTARSLAAIYAAFLAGGAPGRPWVGSELRSEATRTQSEGIDEVLGRPSRFGLGFQLHQAKRPMGPNPRSFGHRGYGGSVGFADPDAGLAFGYVTTRLGERWDSSRPDRLIDAVYECL